MLIDTLLLTVGLALLLGGGDLMVRGASALARNLGVSPLVIGLTVVAFGTSAPELAVNVLAAIRGTGDISFGNIIGSNMANIGLILGITAIVRPLDVRASLIRREIPFMIVATLLVLLMTLDRPIFGWQVDAFQRHDGIILLVCFAAFLVYTAAKVRQDRSAAALVEGVAAPKDGAGSVAMNSVKTIAGMAGLLYGGHLTVVNAVDLARTIGVSETIIGLTIVAVGTSLPELVTAVIAAIRKQSDLAVGNVIGSNLFNLLFVLGVTTVVRPVQVPPGGLTDLIVVTALSVILLPIAITSQSRITRAEGVGLLAAYLGYIVWRTVLSG